MVEENPNDVIVESGNVSNMTDRLGLVASLLAEMKYDAVGVGETDLRISGDEFFKQMAQNKLAVLDLSPSANKTAIPYLVKETGGVKVGVISFGATRSSDNISDLEKRKAILVAYKAVREKSDVLVVLDEANVVNRDWVERMGKRFGQPDIVIGGAARAYMAKEEVIGKTHIVQTSVQGKHVGVIDVEIVQGQEPKLTTKRISLEPEVAEDPAVSKKVKEFMAKIKPAPSSSPTQTGAAQVITAAGGKPYYPPSLCRTCHAKEYQDWQSTMHARAIKTLTSQNRAIPECLKCHSEMFRRLQKVTFSPNGIGGVECASCHASSLPHGVERKNATVKTRVNTKMCLECHDRENSPKYEEKSYLAKVSHLAATDAPETATTTKEAPTPSVATPAPPAMK